NRSRHGGSAPRDQRRWSRTFGATGGGAGGGGGGGGVCVRGGAGGGPCGFTRAHTSTCARPPPGRFAYAKSMLLMRRRVPGMSIGAVRVPSRNVTLDGIENFSLLPSVMTTLLSCTS